MAPTLRYQAKEPGLRDSWKQFTEQSRKYKAQGACGKGEDVPGVKEGALKGETENQ